MGIIETLLISLGLSMDAFAVAVCKGLSTLRVKKKHYLIVGLWFGGFQALMPLLGYLAGSTLERYIHTADHLIAFVLLSGLGIKMILDAFKSKEENLNSSFTVKAMFPQAVATSIDALAVGVTFALTKGGPPILFIVSVIGFVTFCMSAFGMKIGNVFGSKYKKKAEFAGGIILLLLGVKILLEGLGVIHF